MNFDTVFSTAVRNELEATVEAPTRRSRRIALGVGGVVIASLLVATGGAVAGKWFVPGSDVITPTSEWHEVSGPGSQTVDLGTRPDGSNSVRGSLICTSAGHFEIATGVGEGTSFDCTDDIPFGTNNNLVIKLADGEHSAVVTATGSWTLRYRWSDRQVTEWGVNENGQTYGTPNENGDPDLTGVYATNGKIGYVYADEARQQGAIYDDMPTDVDTDDERLAYQLEHCGDYYPAIPVYTSDGVTVIGEFGGSENTEPGRISIDGETWYDC